MPAAPALSVSYDPDRNSVFYLSDDGSKAVTYGSNILQISDVSTGAVQ